MTRLVVAPGGLITSAWGNQTHDQSQISFASATQRGSDWPAPPDGALSWLADSHTPWVWRGGTWHPYPLGYLGAATGPGSSQDVTTVQSVVTLNVPVVAGRRYRIYGGGQGAQVTATGPIVYFHLLDGDGGTTRITQANALAVGQALVGYGSAVYAPSATKTATVAVQALANGGALRISANLMNISVDDIGG